ncbi:MAG: hypothetical protein M5T61_21395 [Acidimicrobiia bacterium]|nr:hypothetical protein [Acidimicrobiia bacterium]
MFTPFFSNDPSSAAASSIEKPNWRIGAPKRTIRLPSDSTLDPVTWDARNSPSSASD